MKKKIKNNKQINKKQVIKDNSYERLLNKPENLTFGLSPP